MQTNNLKGKKEYNPYRGVYMVCYLAPSHNEYEDYGPVKSLDHAPELIHGSIARVRQEIIRNFNNPKFTSADIKGYTIKVYQKSKWVEIERQILIK